MDHSRKYPTGAPRNHDDGNYEYQHLRIYLLPIHHIVLIYQLIACNSIKENLSSHIGGMERFWTGQGMGTAPGQLDRLGHLQSKDRQA
jgi:hypothetical protein